MTFGRTFWAAALAWIAVWSVLFLFVILIIVGAAAGSSKKGAAVRDNSILHLSLNSPITETAEPSGFEFDLGDFLPVDASTRKIGLFQLVETLEKAKGDDRIRGIYLDMGAGPQGGWATMQTVRKALIDFKASKKFVYAYSEMYSEKSYYLASVADSIFLTPSGMMEFNGLSATPMFYTGLFEKLEIKPEIFKVGTFKSAVEPYFRKDMSEENKMQVREFLGDIWNGVVAEIAASRNLAPARLNEIATNGIFFDGVEAQTYGLVHKAAYEQHVRDLLRKASGITDMEEKLRFVSLGEYMKTPAKTEKKDSENKVAVIFAQGAIQSGKSGDDVIGSETVIKALREARENKDVKAVVLRINSPGGSALASDVMNEEIRLTKKVKPVIASMGDVAASGGYYIASNCDRIFAQENTITGSIGIFGILYNTKGLFNNKLGLTFDHVTTNENADFGDPNFPFSDMQRAVMTRYIHKGYGGFVEVVRSGRNFPDSAAVDKIAQGRVWSGADARGINLVDDFGNLYDAVKYAAKKVGIENDYEMKIIADDDDSPLKKIFGGMSRLFADEAAAQNPLKEEMEEVRLFKKHIPAPGAYMLLPYEFDIH